MMRSVLCLIWFNELHAGQSVNYTWAAFHVALESSRNDFRGQYFRAILVTDTRSGL